MAKLYFNYSTMNAGKSTLLLQAAHNYGERGMEVYLLTARLDTRAGEGRIGSRIGLGREADTSVISGNAMNIASWHGDAAGLLLADAPYGSGEGLTVAARLAVLGALAPGALVVIETEECESHDEKALADGGLALLDDRRYGRARLHFLRYKG